MGKVNVKGWEYACESVYRGLFGKYQFLIVLCVDEFQLPETAYFEKRAEIRKKL